MKMKKIANIITWSLVVILSLGYSMTASAKGSGNYPVVKKWEIPFLSVLTGPVAFAGLPAVWGAEYAAKQINAAGGIRGIPVEIVEYDTAFDPAKAISLMSRQVGKSLIVLGPMDAPGGEAAGPLAAEEGVPLIAALTNPEIREKCKPYGAFYARDSIDGDALAALEWVKLNPDIKKVAGFFIPTDPGPARSMDAVEAALKTVGVELKRIEVQTGQVNMGPSVVKAMNTKADGYYTILRLGEYAKLVTELNNRGMTDGRRVCSTFAALAAPLFEMAKGKLENTYIWNMVDVYSDNATWQELVTAYQADHDGQYPMLLPVPAFYDAVFTIKDAFETLQITGDPALRKEERRKIAEYLFNTGSMAGILGHYQYVNGEKIAPFHFYQVHDNSLVHVSELSK